MIQLVCFLRMKRKLQLLIISNHNTCRIAIMKNRDTNRIGTLESWYNRIMTKAYRPTPTDYYVFFNVYYVIYICLSLYFHFFIFHWNFLSVSYSIVIYVTFFLSSNICSEPTTSSQWEFGHELPVFFFLNCSCCIKLLLKSNYYQLFDPRWT